MRTRTSGLSISVYFSICLGLTFVAASILIIAVVNREMRNKALSDARERTNILLERNLATHEYFSQEMKPKIFEKIGEFESEDYFEPTWMSSTYAIRQIDKYFKSISDQYGDYYYKECAVNARSPQNEADDYEKAFIEELNKEPDLLTRSEIHKIDGRAYFVTLHRGEMMAESCLRCHSTPDNAPGDLVAQYGSERSFNRSAGDAVSAISIRVPLSKAYAATRALTIKLSILLMVILGLMFSVLYFFMRRAILQPLRIIKNKSSEISFDPKHLGDKIPLPNSKELGEVVSAFNNMSISLRHSRDHLEEEVKNRTNDLQRTNQELTAEIIERKNAEQSLCESQRQMKEMLANVQLFTVMLDEEGVITYVNEYLLKKTGYTREELVGGNWFDIFIPAEVREEIRGVHKEVLSGNLELAGHYTNELLKKSGERRIVTWNNTLFNNVLGGDIVGTTSIGEDITERTLAEERINNLAKFPSENPNPVLRISSDGRILYGNSASEMLLNAWGCRGAETLSRDYHKIVKETLSAGRPSTIESDCPCGKTFSINLTPVLEEDYVNIYGLDVTERKEVESALQARTYDLGERVKELNCLYGLSHLAAQDGISLEDIFQGLAELIQPGWQYPEITAARITFEGRRFETSNFRKTAWIQSADIKVNGQKSGSIEVCYLKKMSEIDEGPFLKEERDLLKALAAGIGKIISHKRADKMLRIERDNLKNIFEAMEDGIYIVDQQYDIQYVNPVLTKDFGVYKGRKCYEYFHDGTKVCSWCKNPEVFAGKTVRWQWHSFEHQKTYDLIDTPLNNSDGSISKLEIFRDITELKKAENELKDSHDKLEARVRQRTNELAQTVDVLQDEIDQRKEIQEALQKSEDEYRKLNVKLENQATQLRGLNKQLIQAEQAERRRLAKILHDHLQQILVSAKLNIGVVTLKSKETSVCHSLKEVNLLLDDCIDASRSLTVELCPPVLHEGGLIPAIKWLARRFENQYQLTVAIDADGNFDHIEQDCRVFMFEAVRELLFNIVKHAETNTARIKITCLADKQIELVIEDEGVGFDAEQYQNREDLDGGFGLFSIRERTAAIGGILDISSCPGKGTRATLLVSPSSFHPVNVGVLETQSRPSSVPEQLLDSGEPVGSRSGDGKIRVLLAEDHTKVRESLKSLLGHESDIEVVAEACNGKVAVEMASREQPEIVVMDINMPIMDGIEATRRIKSKYPHIRVIALSAHEQEDMTDAILQVGAESYLSKKNASEQLVATIRSRRNYESRMSTKPAT